MKVNVEEKLGVNKFYVDEENPHIVLKKDSIDMKEFKKLVIACPAGLYSINEDGSVRFDYAGCLECGTCRVLCHDTILEKWEFPRGTLGVEYRYG
ncbi:4Fe-4S dicluster domain-containing protein [Symbiobacterium thermophilum]|uniref:Ferredoxin family protein n=1 Tax=Symbiobacterium thermophilum TaxID=2734 RepID=A0A953I9E3_SYMTR|nr:4Fe-4S dicluster domain-containing protein [Symbiobacterium thermophilum]MBY6276041.1 ferredoxin family protein [Symbiobacterium thermophilum]